VGTSVTERIAALAAESGLSVDDNARSLFFSNVERLIADSLKAIDEGKKSRVDTAKEMQYVFEGIMGSFMPALVQGDVEGQTPKRYNAMNSAALHDHAIYGVVAAKLGFNTEADLVLDDTNSITTFRVLDNDDKQRKLLTMGVLAMKPETLKLFTEEEYITVSLAPVTVCSYVDAVGGADRAKGVKIEVKGQLADGIGSEDKCGYYGSTTGKEKGFDTDICELTVDATHFTCVCTLPATDSGAIVALADFSAPPIPPEPLDVVAIALGVSFGLLAIAGLAFGWWYCHQKAFSLGDSSDIESNNKKIRSITTTVGKLLKRFGTSHGPNYRNSSTMPPPNTVEMGQQANSGTYTGKGSMSSDIEDNEIMDNPLQAFTNDYRDSELYNIVDSLAHDSDYPPLARSDSDRHLKIGGEEDECGGEDDDATPRISITRATDLNSMNNINMGTGEAVASLRGPPPGARGQPPAPSARSSPGGPPPVRR